MITILLIEDDNNIRRLYKDILTEEGYNVLEASDGLEALEFFDSHHINLILVDIMMPNMDGMELTKLLRQSNIDIPLIMISAKSDSFTKLEGFRAGIDDYMTKPIDEEELLLRIKAILRRSDIFNERKISVGDVELRYDSFSVVKDNKELTLPKKEFLLLYKLASYPGKIFTRTELLNEIWGRDNDSLESTVNVHINKLRNRFQDYKEFEIVTVRGLGYKVMLHD